MKLKIKRYTILYDIIQTLSFGGEYNYLARYLLDFLIAVMISLFLIIVIFPLAVSVLYFFGFAFGNNIKHLSGIVIIGTIMWVCIALFVTSLYNNKVKQTIIKIAKILAIEIEYH